MFNPAYDPLPMIDFNYLRRVISLFYPCKPWHKHRTITIYHFSPLDLSSYLFTIGRKPSSTFVVYIFHCLKSRWYFRDFCGHEPIPVGPLSRLGPRWAGGPRSISHMPCAPAIMVMIPLPNRPKGIYRKLVEWLRPVCITVELYGVVWHVIRIQVHVARSIFIHRMGELGLRIPLATWFIGDADDPNNFLFLPSYFSCDFFLFSFIFVWII